MNNTIRLLIACVLAAFAVAAISFGMARHGNDLSAPFNLILLVIGIGVYFLPTMLAIYRNCHATSWISIINLLLGWTILGWFAAIGWAASGKVETFPPTIAAPPGNPITGH
jgi:RsiW-degrading membrane proteinase PrsW (M82 family)